MSDVIVECRKVTRVYGEEGSVQVHALRGVDLEVRGGEFVSMAGPSGSGKSTLLNVIGGLDRVTAGEVIVGGERLTEMSKSELAELRLHKIGFVFQAYNLIPVLSARENVEFIMQLQGVGARERRKRALDMLEEVGLGATIPTSWRSPRATSDSSMVRSPPMTGRCRPLERVRSSLVPSRGFAARGAPAKGARRAALILLWLACAGSHAVEWQGRVKAFGSYAVFPDHALLKQLNGSPQQDYSLDLRNVFKQRAGAWTLFVDHELTFIGGDSRGAPSVRVEDQVRDDDRRLWNLTWELDEGSDHRLTHRLDRLAVEYRRSNLSVSIGRQAVSWGYGVAFQPADFVNPFSPTQTDRDYKAGDDLALAQYLFADGSDFQAIAVGHRDEDEKFGSSTTTFAGKWHGFAGPVELDVIAAKHYRDQVYGFGLILPVKGAVIRSQWVGTLLDGGDWKQSAVINGDYSLALWNRTLYLYAEYY
ncbi:MAG: ATP-binding cassette domain-containing protein, partial [Gammaproteobacteria bacterium]